jgi:hypothetical protein
MVRIAVYTASILCMTATPVILSLEGMAGWHGVYEEFKAFAGIDT